MTEAWRDDVVRALDRRIAEAGAQPDFLDVVTRAHELDPDAVPWEQVEQADAWVAAEVPALEERGSMPHEAALDDWLDDVKAAVERRVDERAEEPLPELRAERTRRGALWAAGAVLAAAILLVLGVGQVVRTVALVPGQTPSQSPLVVEPSGTTGTVERVAPRPEASRPRPRMQPRETEEHEAVVIPEPEPEPEPASVETESTPPPRARHTPTKQQRLESLAAQALEHWRAGRRDQARRLFAEVVAQGGKSRAAEMAYADLFTLASQAGDRADQRKWWRAYLRRFPRGRFADDARAGLCRAAKDDHQTCWAAYLEDFPQGSFRAEARATQEPR